MYAANLLEINCLGFMSHWVKMSHPPAGERLTYTGVSVTQKPAELDLFQQAALLISKVRLTPNLLEFSPRSHQIHDFNGLDGHIHFFGACLTCLLWDCSPYITLWGQQCHLIYYPSRSYPSFKFWPWSHSLGRLYDISMGSNHYLFKIPLSLPQGP